MKKIVFCLTLYRILAGPAIFLFVIFFKANLLALLIFISASLSDYLDGKLARTYKVESSLGATLDPIADKILVVFVLIAIVLATNNSYVAGMTAIMLAREFWISALREYASKKLLSNTLAVTFLAKVKTTIQFIAITTYLLGFSYNNALILFVADFVLLLAMLVTLLTAVDYSKKILNSLTESSEE